VGELVRPGNRRKMRSDTSFGGEPAAAPASGNVSRCQTRLASRGGTTYEMNLPQRSEPHEHSSDVRSSGVMDNLERQSPHFVSIYKPNAAGWIKPRRRRTERTGADAAEASSAYLRTRLAVAKAAAAAMVKAEAERVAAPLVRRVWRALAER
jgi:hypothetical protein